MKTDDDMAELIRRIKSTYGDPAAILATDDGQALLDQAIHSVAADAITAQSDPGAPAEIQALAVIANVETQADITAITHTTCTKYLPDGPVADRLAWSTARLLGKPVSPPVKIVIHNAWQYHCLGNPVNLERWLQTHGYPGAFNHEPAVVRICLAGDPCQQGE